jgi:hypothetical protein
LENFLVGIAFRVGGGDTRKKGLSKAKAPEKGEISPDSGAFPMS